MGNKRAGYSSVRSDAAIALGVATLLFIFYAASGFPSLTQYKGDNDSLMRLVEVRDLLGGQGWFDLHQYRMGTKGGFVMHWSRFVDAPIAAIILAATALTGSIATGETVALVVWPLFLFGAALFLLLRAVRAVGGEFAILPAVVVGSASLYFLGLFVPGAIDHHNLQLVLTLAMLVALMNPADGRAIAAAGACAALMLTVGMETVPYVAGGCALAALAFALDSSHGRRVSIGFGTAFAVICAVAFLATVPFGHWGKATCDAYSIAQFALAALGGLGLAAIAFVMPGRSTPARRLGALALLGIAVAAVAAILFPDCLQNPYDSIEPRLRSYWLDNVSEAQPFWRILVAMPALAASYYATALLGVSVLAWRIRRDGPQRPTLVLAALMLPAFLVSIWQVRGAMFSIPLAAIALSAWVGEWRERAAGKVPTAVTLSMLSAWLLSFNVTWAVAATSLTRVIGQPRTEAANGDAGKCQRAVDYDRLAALPAGGVLAISNLGAPILRYSGHHVLAGPYHRNIQGNLLALSAFMDPPATTETIVRQQNISYVALCPGNDETSTLAEWAPDGFIATMLKGDVPDWLVPLPGSEHEALRVYKVRPRG
jgi:hypothetical protein